MKRLRVLTRYELAILSALAMLMVTLTLVLLNIGFQAPILV
jgi:hypothetical protein